MKATALLLAFALVSMVSPAHAETQLTKDGRAFYINGNLINAGSTAAGLLVNVRMVNSVFEDTKRPAFDAQANTNEFLARMPDYLNAGINAFTISLQGGNPGYEGARNTAINPDGTLKASYMDRVAQVIDAADAKGAVIILGIYYQRQDQYVRDQAAVKAGVVNVMKWVASRGYKNVIVEISNEYGHSGFDHAILRSASGVASLISLAKQTAPGIMVTASGYGDGNLAPEIIAASSVLVIHLNGVDPSSYSKKINALKSYNKPIVCNEDPKAGSTGATAASSAVNAGGGWGYLHRANQDYPFYFKGPTEASTVYNRIKSLAANTSGTTQATTQAVTSLALVNADTDQVIGTMSNGMVLDFAQLGTQRLNIVAVISSSSIGSVRFVEGTDYRIENGAPYALAGNSGDDFYPWTPIPGNHLIKVTPYSSTGASGTAGETLQLNFSVVSGS
jgi:hypothetical protein